MQERNQLIFPGGEGNTIAICCFTDKPKKVFGAFKMLSKIFWGENFPAASPRSVTHLTGIALKSNPVAWHRARRRVEYLQLVIPDCAHEHPLRNYAAHIHRLQIAHHHHHPVTHLKNVLSLSQSRLNCGEGRTNAALVWWKGHVVEGN